MTTYVLGAGASRHAGYPFAKSMGAELFGWMKLQPSSGYPNYPGVAAYFQENFQNSDDFEELLSDTQQLIQEYENGTSEQRLERGRVANLRSTLLLALRDWFGEIQQQSAVAYQQFSNEIIQPGDCIITFNYDLSLDRTLHSVGKWNLGDGYGFPVDNFPSSSPVKLLKLHGSTNWFAAPFGGRKGFFVANANNSLGTRPIFLPNDLSFLGYQNQVDPLMPTNGNFPAFPVLILPTRKKEFFYKTSFGPEWDWFWDDLWNQAASALHQSTNIVLCGYSLLTVDERACDLLLNTTNRKATISISSGSDSERIAQQFRDAGYSNVVGANERLFENWVTGMLSTHA